MDQEERERGKSGKIATKIIEIDILTSYMSKTRMKNNTGREREKEGERKERDITMNGRYIF
jgi:hypothetical protein